MNDHPGPHRLSADAASSAHGRGVYSYVFCSSVWPTHMDQSANMQGVVQLQSRRFKVANETSDQRGGSGNFANDPEKASEAGKKGGEQSKGNQR